MRSYVIQLRPIALSAVDCFIGSFVHGLEVVFFFGPTLAVFAHDLAHVAREIVPCFRLLDREARAWRNISGRCLVQRVAGRCCSMNRLRLPSFLTPLLLLVTVSRDFLTLFQNVFDEFATELLHVLVL